MFRTFAALLLFVCVGAAQVTPREKPASRPVRVSPKVAEKPKVDANLLRRGTRVVVHAIITKTGTVTDIKYVKGNQDLMPEALKAIKSWKYKPYLYEGKPVEVETTVTVSFDPLTGG